MNPEYSEDYLQHYGMLGMKWGVRKGNASAAYAKSARKAQRLKNKYQKQNVRAAKKDLNATKKLGRYGFSKTYAKASSKAAKAHYKAAKTQKKLAKWEKYMSKEFANVSVKDISPEHLSAGREYVYMLMK